MQFVPVPDMPEVQEGDSIGELIQERITLSTSDIIVIASTVVSKAEGRDASLSEYDPGPRAREIAARFESITGDSKDARFAQAVLEESTEVLIEAPFLLTVTRFGHIGVNAGIDRSNVKNADILLLPRRPAESATQIQDTLPDDNPVIITDTCGRPFRHGQTGVAIGWAGLDANRDWRGQTDRDGHELTVTVESVVDELAGAANLLMGEADHGIPVVIVRDHPLTDYSGTNECFRDVESDYVRAALRDWEFDE